MASIVRVKRKNAPDGYQAVVRKKGHKPIKKTFDKKGDAKRWAEEQEALIYAKRYRDPRLAEMVSLEDALEKYRQEGFLMQKAPSTMDREIYSRRNLERILGGQSSLGSIDSGKVNDYQSKRVGEGASNSSIRQELAMLSKMFNRARRIWGLPVDNPVDNVDRVAPGPQRDRFLSTEESALVVAEAKRSSNERFYPFVLILMHTGMRTGEAARLHESRVDLDARSVIINKTKSGKPRNVPLTAEVVKALKSIKPIDGYYFLKPNHLASKHIMLRPGNIFRDCWTNLWKRLDKREDITVPRFRPHDIRHTAGSHLLMAGVDVRIIADILGHSTLQMVMRYTHLMDSHRQDVIDKINYLGKGEDTFAPEDESYISSGL